MERVIRLFLFPGRAVGSENMGVVIVGLGLYSYSYLFFWHLSCSQVGGFSFFPFSFCGFIYGMVVFVR